MSTKSLRPKHAAELLGIGPATLWRWVNEKKAEGFPQPIRLSARCTVFDQDALIAWRDGRMTNAGKPVKKSGAPIKLEDRFDELLGKYWVLAYSEGVEKRDHDTEDGEAQKTLHELQGLFRAAITLKTHDAIEWVDEFGATHRMPAAAATDLLRRLFDEWPDGLDEIEASVRSWRERAQRFEAELALKSVEQKPASEA